MLPPVPCGVETSHFTVETSLMIGTKRIEKKNCYLVKYMKMKIYTYITAINPNQAVISIHVRILLHDSLY